MNKVKPLSMEQLENEEDLGDRLEKDGDGDSSSSDDDSDSDGGLEPEVDKRVMDVNTLRNECNHDVMFQRVVDTAAEEIAQYARSRMPDGERVSLLSLVECTRKSLQYFYKLAPGTDRKFLLINEYRMACEIEAVKAGWINKWCSLCRLPTSLKTFKEQRQHFEKHHSLCASLFKCKRCNSEFNLPSKYYFHVAKCDPEAVADLKMKAPYIEDAYLDYKAARSTGGNKRMFLVAPGYPSIWKVGGPSHAKGQYKLLPDELDMDIDSGCAVKDGQKLPVEPVRYTIQHGYCSIDSFEQLNYTKECTLN